MPDQLTQTVTDFEQWRREKTGKSSSTPVHLRKQAVALLAHYSKNSISTALRISGTQFKRWRLDYQAPEQLPDFIPLPMLTEFGPRKPLTLEMKLVNGDQLSLAGELSIEQIIHLTLAIKS